MAETARPSLVVLRSHIGYPSPKYTDTAKAHGEALGADEVAAVKEILGLPPEDFYAPDDVIGYYREAVTSFPNVAFIALDPVTLQQQTQFILKVDFLVVLRLTGNISSYLFDL